MFLMLACSSEHSAQIVHNDSLSGFDASSAVIKSHEYGIYGVESKVYLEYAKREFINRKYNLLETISANISSRKYGNPIITAAPCIDEGFEGLSIGALNSPAWASELVTIISHTAPCQINFSSGIADTSQAEVIVTPHIDLKCNNVSNSPLGGTQVLALNTATSYSYRESKVKHTFSVTSTNFIYNYVYKAVLNSYGNHVCCMEPKIYFNFYDCNSTLISSLCDTIYSKNCVSNLNSDAAFWTFNVTNGIYYTPNWVSRFADLSNYIGSCITVEVSAAQCGFGAHEGYLYYDASCSNSPTFMTTSSITTCAQSLVSVFPVGFSNYLWQGPPGSGVSGYTAQTIAANFAGTYTASASSGSITMTQTLNLSLLSTPTLTIVSSPTICSGNSTTLSINTSSQNTVIWSTGVSSTSIVVAPTANTVYSVLVQNSLGCASTAIATIGVIPQIGTMISNNYFNPIFCSGHNMTLYAYTTNTNVSFLWSTGSTFTQVTVSPTINTIYSFTATNGNGCDEVKSLHINVFKPTLSITSANSNTICEGLITFSVTAPAASTHTWSWINQIVTHPGGHFSPTLSINLKQPTLFLVISTSSNGCQAMSSINVFTKPIPTLTITPSNNIFCEGVPVGLNLNGTGLDFFTWYFGNTATTLTAKSITVTPPPNYYQVVATNSLGCSASTHIQRLLSKKTGSVNFVTPSGTLICPNEKIDVLADLYNVQTYTWSSYHTGTNIVVSPISTTTYSLRVTDNNFCEFDEQITIIVDPCTEIVENFTNNFGIRILPNPSKGIVTIDTKLEFEISISNTLGQIVLIEKHNSEDVICNLTHLTTGVYNILIRTKEGDRYTKIILED